MRTRLYPAIPDSAVHPRLTIGSLTRRGFGGGGMSAWCRPGPSAGIAASAYSSSTRMRSLLRQLVGFPAPWSSKRTAIQATFAPTTVPSRAPRARASPADGQRRRGQGEEARAPWVQGHGQDAPGVHGGRSRGPCGAARPVFGRRRRRVQGDEARRAVERAHGGVHAAGDDPSGAIEEVEVDAQESSLSVRGSRQPVGPDR